MITKLISKSQIHTFTLVINLQLTDYLFQFKDKRSRWEANNENALIKIASEEQKET